MPILAQKDNPPSKPFEGSILKKEGTWWIANVKPHQEKAFAFDLLKQGIDYYLPYYTNIVKRTDGKLRKSLLVLFSSYVPFISEDPYIFLRSKRVVSVLVILAQKRFKYQMNQIFTANQNHISVLPVKKKIIEGDLARIVNGPFAGITGKLTRFNNLVSIVMEIDGMNSVSLLINSANIQPV